MRELGGTSYLVGWTYAVTADRMHTIGLGTVDSLAEALRLASETVTQSPMVPRIPPSYYRLEVVITPLLESRTPLAFASAADAPREGSAAWWRRLRRAFRHA